MEASVDTVLKGILWRLEDIPVMRRKSKRLCSYMRRLQGEVSNLRKLNSPPVDEVELEDVLQKIYRSTEAIQSWGGWFGAIISFLTSRLELNVLDDLFQDLILLLEPSLQSKGKQIPMEDILEQLGEEQREENENDLEDDTAVFYECLHFAKSTALRKSAAMVEKELTGLTSKQANERISSKDSTRESVEVLAVNALEALDMEQADIPLAELEIFPKDVIGASAFGPVCHGRWRGRDVLVMKVCPGSCSLRAQDLLRKKVAMWKSFESPYLSKIFGTSYSPGEGLFLVLEELDVSLQSVLDTDEHDNFTIDQAEAVMSALAKGIAFLHSKNIIHRDIRPANIWLSQDLGTIKISPFAIDYHVATNAQIAYMAPECDSEVPQWTTRSDVYAFAMTIWEVIHRERVYRIAGRPKFDDKHKTPSWIKSMLTKCWERDVKLRPFSTQLVKEIDSKRKLRPRSSARIVKRIVEALQQGRRSIAKQPPVTALRSQLRRSLSSSSTSASPFSAPVETSVASFRPTPSVTGTSAVERPISRLQSIPLMRASSAPPSFQQDQGQGRNPIFSIGSQFSKSSASEKKRPPKLPARPLSKNISTILKKAYEKIDKKESNSLADAMEEIAALIATMERGVYTFDPKRSADLLMAIRLSINDEAAQRWAMVILRLMALSDPKNRQLLLEQGFHSHVLESMRIHRASAAVQANACVALYAFLLINGAPDMGCQMAFLSFGACMDVLEAMKLHRNDPRVQMKACWAIIGLSNGNQAVKSELLRADAPGQVLKAIQALQNDEKVQENALGALWNLMDLSIATQKNVVTQHGPLLIVRAMKTFPSNPTIQENAMGCLRCLLTVLGEEKRHLVKKTSLGEFFVNLLTEFPDNPSLHVLVFDLSAKLAETDADIQQRFASVGLMALGEEVRVRYAQNPMVLEAVECFFNAILGDNAL